jgi:antitoxin (DNA-binding transcriptional repressor) of toxin-antitoxin stability system
VYPGGGGLEVAPSRAFWIHYVRSDHLICVEQLTATEAARRFSEVLDAIEHQGTSYLVMRNGRPVAHIEPAAGATGRAAKDFLRRHAPDPDWARELRELRSGLVLEERDWTG